MKLRDIFLPLAITVVAFAAEPTPKTKAPANRLAQESSPYLLQHAHNPVDWYPWGEEAFAKAKKNGKFIFLSIGYSSCHWCHVMERETFENKDVAKIINENFVCIKVDREERPDIDDIYMTALHVTGSQGGWPLSMFLTSEGKPIFGGTYFPPDDKKISDEDTIPGFKSILKKVIELKKDKSKELHEQADHVAKLTAEELDRSAGFMPIGKMDASWASDAANQYELDPTHGGLGSKRREFAGTKFPRVSALLLLQSQSAKPGQENLAKLFTLTMEKMNEGGIYDHLGGGFHRYSTERTWTVPHFEKMLYDNAQLVELYAKEYARKPREDYRRVIDETLVWMAREMTAPEGYFYSALDADSEGEEGKFYVWEAKELDALLGTGEDAKLFRDVYSLNKVNFEDKYHILRLPKSWAELAKTHKHTETELVAKLEPLKKKLLDVRSKRHRPFLDTKLITSWNGQMIAAYALAGQVLKEKRYTETGEKAAEFILKTMKDKDGRLLRIYAGKPGEKSVAKVRAFLDDYAFLIHGLLALHDATGNKRWLDESARLQKELQTNFGDEKRGGYFNTPNDGEKLFARGKDSYDGAQPSGNGIAVRNSVRLWVKTQDEAYRANAQKSLRSSSPAMKTAPTSVPVALDTLDQFIALKGLKDEPATTTEFKAPEKPIDSTDVVKVEAKLTGNLDGIDTYIVNIEIAKGWHIYANKVDNKTLLESSTVVEVLVNGKIDPLAETVYPAGSVIEDAKAGNYKVYDGKAT